MDPRWLRGRKFKYRKQKWLLNNRLFRALFLPNQVYDRNASHPFWVTSPFSPSCSFVKTSKPIAVGILAISSSVKSLLHTGQELQERKKGVRTVFFVPSANLINTQGLFFLQNIFLIHSFLYPQKVFPKFHCSPLPWIVSNRCILLSNSFGALPTLQSFENKPPQIAPPACLSF